MSNTITAFFKGRKGVCESVYQYDYGMVIAIDGIDFTNDFDCYFSTTGQDEAIPAIGSDNRVAIPNDCLTRAGVVTLHIPAHTGANDSEVEYVVTFKVIGRAKPVDDGSAEEQSALSKAIALLNHTNSSVIETINSYLDENAAEPIQDWLDEHPEATTTVQDGAITESKFHTSLWNKIHDDINDAMSDGISFETGSTDTDVYTIFTIPKTKFSMSLVPVADSPDEAVTIKEFALKNRPYLCLNISNTADFICNSQLYGEDFVQGTNGSIYALKEDSTDFDVFENGTRLSSLIDSGYNAAIAAWNCLRQDNVDKNVNWDFSTYATPQPRQVLAWDEDNWYIYTSYSRISYAGSNYMENKVGKTMYEILQFCKSKGWPNVAALDGGGSIYLASGNPFRQLSPCVNNGYYREAHMCVVFNLK